MPSWCGHGKFFFTLPLGCTLIQVYLLHNRTHTILRYILIFLSHSMSTCCQWCLTFVFYSWIFLGFLFALIWIIMHNIKISHFIYLSWTLFVYSRDKSMVSHLLQCNAVSLKVTDSLQSVRRVLYLYQPSITLLSVFVCI